MALVVSSPAPSTTSYVRCGRGGAGNTFHGALVSSPPSTTKTLSSALPVRFFSGIGGAGNALVVAERPLRASVLRDVVLLAEARDRAPVGYCGRGGAGNVYRRTDASLSLSSSSSLASSSVRSDASSTARLWHRVSGSLGRE
ncbi:hypothetical protein NOR_06231 [Metarhizium rileyi]|uniref:Uncharacterized protein n=1 Tax=Metarhizium rileyi (strain RCEF 4871) TaxID=1649241 RepID=A0A167AWD6_METRR|nr:hypothetical protein NOR_06231 [Metarhizium rileyi RCEF 4871]